MIVADSISKRFMTGNTVHSVLDDVNIRIEPKEVVSLTGPSGSGKTTLMNIIGLLDTPSGGRVVVNSRDTSSLSPSERADLRNNVIGFVFQSFHLLPYLSALDNVSLPLIYRGLSRSRRRAVASERLRSVGLEALADRKPAQMSGGQRQRVAIARSLVGDPSLILADEPTGNLDSRTAREIMQLLFEINDRCGTAILLVTHDLDLAAACPRRIVMRDGRIDGHVGP